MGIRFDRDARRATNGPMIFFSILKDETFEEEIRSAYLSGLSFYAYRYPKDNMMSYGSSEGYVEGLGTPGFIIGMFDPEYPIITIPYDGIRRVEKPLSLYVMPERSTTYEEYRNEVEEIIKDLKENKGSKVVASRVIVREERLDMAEKFYELCSRFPDAFVFCFSTPATGCWIGASPELLLESSGETLHSMALAGTRPVGSDTSWDDKNIEEQSIVTDYILGIFRRNGFEPEAGETYTKAAGKIEHICTPINAYKGDKETKISNEELGKLLKDLAPTPALCGCPKEFAFEEIKRLEKFDRGCYGGYCGPFHSAEDFHFNVVLRCASISERKICSYVGGGITSHSEVLAEWKETELKSSFGAGEQ